MNTLRTGYLAYIEKYHDQVKVHAKFFSLLFCTINTFETELVILNPPSEPHPRFGNRVLQIRVG